MSAQSIHDVYRKLLKALKDDPEIINENGFLSLLRRALDVATEEESAWFTSEREKLDKEMLLTKLSVYLLTDKDERIANEMPSGRYAFGSNIQLTASNHDASLEKTKLDLLKAYAEQQRKKIEDELANNRL